MFLVHDLAFSKARREERLALDTLFPEIPHTRLLVAPFCDHRKFAIKQNSNHSRRTSLSDARERRNSGKHLRSTSKPKWKRRGSLQLEAPVAASHGARREDTITELEAFNEDRGASIRLRRESLDVRSPSHLSERQSAASRRHRYSNTPPDSASVLVPKFVSRDAPGSATTRAARRLPKLLKDDGAHPPRSPKSLHSWSGAATSAPTPARRLQEEEVRLLWEALLKKSMTVCSRVALERAILRPEDIVLPLLSEDWYHTARIRIKGKDSTRDADDASRHVKASCTGHHKSSRPWKKMQSEELRPRNEKPFHF